MAERKETEKMNVLVKILIVFDLLCFGVYFGGDILSTALAKVRKKPAKKELFEFYAEDADTPSGSCIPARWILLWKKSSCPTEKARRRC